MGDRSLSFVTFGKVLCACGIVGYIAVDSGAFEWMKRKSEGAESRESATVPAEYRERLRVAATKIRGELENAKRLRREIAEMGQRLLEQEKSYQRLAKEIGAVRGVAEAPPAAMVTRDLESLARALASDTGAPVKFEPFRREDGPYLRVNTHFSFDRRNPEYLRPRALRRLARLSAGALGLGFEEIRIAHRPSAIAIDRAEGIRRYLTDDLHTSLKVSRLQLDTPSDFNGPHDLELWLGKGGTP